MYIHSKVYTQLSQGLELLQTFQWMSRDSYVPHLFLRTSTESSSQGSAMRGAGTNTAAHVSMCLTPSRYLILLTSGSMLPGADRLMPAPGRASAIPLPWCFSCAEWQRGTCGFLLCACCVSGILGVSACCGLSGFFNWPSSAFLQKELACPQGQLSGSRASLLLGLEVGHASLLLQFLCPWRKHGSRWMAVALLSAPCEQLLHHRRMSAEQ